MVLLIDNYDSFSYNLYQLIGAIEPDVRVVRNDAISVEEIRGLAPDRLVISPGPGRPADAGICVDAVKLLHREFPILGICLGHQAICEAFGGRVSYAKTVTHGKASTVTVEGSARLFRGLGSQIQAGRYHSLAVVEETLPDVLRVIAWAQDGEIMGVCHRDEPVYGVQFHPESILTPCGGAIIANFLRDGRGDEPDPVRTHNGQTAMGPEGEADGQGRR